MRNKIYYISKHFYKLGKKKCKTYSELKIQKEKMMKFLDNIFKQDREEFLNTIKNKLQKGRIRQQLLNYYDSMNITYQQQIEKMFLYGWWYEKHVYNNNEVYEALFSQKGSTRGCTNKASLQYAKFLTEKYGDRLFINPKIA